MPPKLTEEVRGILTSGKPAHLVILNPDGSPQVSVVWIGLEGDEIVCAHIGEWRTIRWTREPPPGHVTYITAERIVRPEPPNWYKSAPASPARADEQAVSP